MATDGGGGSDGGGGGGGRGRSENPFAFPMSQADVKLAKECRDEAFYNRSLPIMLATSGATHFLVKAGKLTPHPKFGSLFKVCWAAFFGNIFGKISYQGNCNQKLKADPNSLLGRALRQRAGQPVLQPTDPAVVDIIDKRENASVVEATPTDAGGYDELRRRNRQGVVAPSSRTVAPPPATPVVPESPIQEDDKEEEVPLEERPMNRRMPVPKPRRNKYGDVVEDD